MANRVFILLALALCCVQVFASGYKPTQESQYCFYSIYSSLSTLTWTDPKSTSSSTSASASSSASTSAARKREISDLGANVHHLEARAKAAKSTYCTSKIEVTSLYASTKFYCNAEELVDGVSFWKALCEYNNATLIDLSTISATVTDAYIADLPTIDPDSGVKSVTAPALLTRSYFERAYRSYFASAIADPTSKRYAFGLTAFWGGIVLLGIISNLFKTLKAAYSTAPTSEKKSGATSSHFGAISAVHHWVRTHVIIPATFKGYHQRRVLWCTIPKRLDFLVVFCFWSLCIILSCVNYRAFKGNTIYATVALQIWNYMPVRMGVMAYSTLPWLWVFAGRNNIFIWATGWNYRTFSIFHRHCARAVTIFGIVHAIGYTVKYTVYSPGKYTTDLALDWFRWGMVAIILMSLILLFSSAWLRVKFYELFLLIHIVFSVILVVALFMHTSKFDGEYNPYLWPLVAIWCFDRFLRIVRLVYCNFRVKFSDKVIKTSFAQISYNKDEDVIRIDAFPGSSMLKPAPGQYYHLYQPFTFRGWENHPFTLGAFSCAESAKAPTSVVEDVEKGALSDVQPASPDLDSDAQLSSETKLTFWVRPYDGWTKRMRTKCLKANGTIREKIFIEGPYGHRAPLHTFDTVIMVTGGTGIASAVPYIQDHAMRSAQGDLRTKKMHLYWAAKQERFIQTLCKQELAPALQRSDFEGHFYHSSGTDVNQTGSDSDEISPVESKSDSWDAGTVEVLHGRPDIKKIVMEAAAEATATNTSVVVLLCGPAQMADAARAAVHAALKDGCRSIEYVEDAFGW